MIRHEIELPAKTAETGDTVDTTLRVLRRYARHNAPLRANSGFDQNREPAVTDS